MEHLLKIDLNLLALHQKIIKKIKQDKELWNLLKEKIIEPKEWVDLVKNNNKNDIFTFLLKTNSSSERFRKTSPLIEILKKEGLLEE